MLTVTWGRSCWPVLCWQRLCGETLGWLTPGPGGIGQGSSDSHQNCPHCFLHSVGRVPGRGAQRGAAELSEHQECGGWPGAFGVVNRKEAWSVLGEGPLPAECGPGEKGGDSLFLLIPPSTLPMI